MTIRLLTVLAVFAGLVYGETWQDRERAFYRLRDSGRGLVTADERLREQLIDALAKDVAWSKSQSSLTEEFTDYQGDLIAVVAGFKDPRSIDVLFELIDSGNMAITALAGFGDASVARALAILRQEHGATTRRHSALLLLSRMVEPENLSRIKSTQAKADLYSGLMSDSKRQ